MKKYKLTLLKDLPDYKAGTEVLNISQEELDGTEDYEYRYWVKEKNFSEIYDLRHNPDWVKIEEDPRCDCETKGRIEIRRNIIGYGRSLAVILDFNNTKIYTWYDRGCDTGSEVSLPIKYCPLCGRKLTVNK